MTYATCFSGIGGWERGLNECGWKLQWQCEIDEFCRQILERDFGVPIYKDARTLLRERPIPVDVICASWPCQPFSIAGRKGGEADNRDLWPTILGVVSSLRPTWFLGENVVNAANMVLDSWQDGLEAAGYQSIAFDIPTCAVGLPTLERHIWIIAARDGERVAGNTKGNGQVRSRLHEWSDGSLEIKPRRWDLPASRLLRSTKGFPDFRNRIRALGNAICPQIPYLIGQAINEIEKDHQPLTPVQNGHSPHKR